MTLGVYTKFSLSANGDFIHTMGRLTGCSSWSGIYELSGTILRPGTLEAKVGGQLECPDGRVLAQFDAATSR
jgi:hypothetical protein